jgi:hypothetical protein
MVFSRLVSSAGVVKTQQKLLICLLAIWWSWCVSKILTISVYYQDNAPPARIPVLDIKRQAWSLILLSWLWAF